MVVIAGHAARPVVIEGHRRQDEINWEGTRRRYRGGIFVERHFFSFLFHIAFFVSALREETAG